MEGYKLIYFFKMAVPKKKKSKKDYFNILNNTKLQITRSKSCRSIELSKSGSRLQPLPYLPTLN